MIDYNRIVIVDYILHPQKLQNSATPSTAVPPFVRNVFFFSSSGSKYDSHVFLKRPSFHLIPKHILFP